MSADLLRCAAEKLREHAAGARGDEPWLAAGEMVMCGEAEDSRYIAEVYGLADKWPNAEYIALMHPPVALALAEWLEAESRTMLPVFPPLRAIAVAREILREPQ